MNPAPLPRHLTLDHLAPLLGALDALSAGDALDLGPVERIDSAGVSLLLELTRRARERRQAGLMLCNPSTQVRALIAFLGVEDLLHIKPSSTDA